MLFLFFFRLCVGFFFNSIDQGSHTSVRRFSRLFAQGTTKYSLRVRFINSLGPVTTLDPSKLKKRPRIKGGWSSLVYYLVSCNALYLHKLSRPRRRCLPSYNYTCFNVLHDRQRNIRLIWPRTANEKTIACGHVYIYMHDCAVRWDTRVGTNYLHKCA